MVDVEKVCCMCGDVGFPDKIFRCLTCNYRFQHTYCSNYYNNESSDPPELCDWCQADVIKSSKHGNTSSKKPNSGDKMKLNDREEGSEKRKSPTGIPSPRSRRYKLLKDVMC